MLEGVQTCFGIYGDCVKGHNTSYLIFLGLYLFFVSEYLYKIHQTINTSLEQRVEHPCPISLLPKWRQFFNSRQLLAAGEQGGLTGEWVACTPARDKSRLGTCVRPFKNVSCQFLQDPVRVSHSYTTDADVPSILYQVAYCH